MGIKGKISFDQERGVGVIGHIIFMIKFICQRIIDETAEQGNVGPGPQAHEKVGLGRGAGKAGVNHDELAPFFLDLGDVLETDGMVFGGVAADDHDAIAVGQIVPVVGHGASTEGGPQRGHGRGMSEAGLMF